MFKRILIVVCTLTSLLVTAQQQNLDYDAVFKNTATGIYAPLPSFVRWIDNDNAVFAERKEGNKRPTEFILNIATGAKTVLPDSLLELKQAEKLLDGALNATNSPNQTMVAFTQKNNLYIKQVGTNSTKQLTFDGSDVILNGYASWIYYEEILGRQSRYKAFWWSNDSKYLAFMRFDDTEVPMYPIYVNSGQHGYTEKTRYPKVGDKNPTVKIGIVEIETGKITWANFNDKEDQYFGMPYFNPNNELWVQWMNRGQDELNIFQIDKQSGAKTLVYKELNCAFTLATHQYWLSAVLAVRRLEMQMKNTPVVASSNGRAIDTENLATPDNSRNCEEPPKLPLAFTVITGIQPARLTKIIGLNAKGGMRKETSAMLSRGQAQRVVVADLNGLKSHLDTLTSAQAVTWGVTKDDAVAVCTQGDTEAQQAGAIARTRENFKFQGRAGRDDAGPRWFARWRTVATPVS
jgi:hypothetical protein